jgi:hypothetical protein
MDKGTTMETILEQPLSIIYPDVETHSFVAKLDHWDKFSPKVQWPPLMEHQILASLLIDPI